MRRVLPALLLVLAAFAILARPGVRFLDARLHAPYGGTAPDARDAAFHDSLWIADLHSDALLWGRGILDRSSRGHVDLPRLQAGGVELQVFSATTEFPVVSNYERTPAVADVIGLLAVVDGWPRETWRSPLRRARYQARTLAEAARDSRGRLRVVRAPEDVATIGNGAGVVGAVLSLEGLHALEGSVHAVDSLFADGFRIFGLAHTFDNEAAGSAHGWQKGGLSPAGWRALARLDSLGGILDLAHASPAAIRDVLSLWNGPVVVSHTGLSAVCPGPRNVTDELVREVAARGGLVGIGFWKQAVCGTDADAIAASILHAVRVAGADHVALGSDFDGAVRTPFDAAGMATLTAALRRAGLADEDVHRVMGGNVRRFLLANLPPAPTP